MEQIKTTAPPVYVIWAEGWTGGPLSGQNGYLAENEDHSGSWKRYEDVLLFQADFQASQPEDLGAWLPVVREALRYTTEQELSRLGKTLKTPASWQSLIDTPQPAGPEMTSLC